MRLIVLNSCMKNEIVRDGRELKFRGLREMWKESEYWPPQKKEHGSSDAHNRSLRGIYHRREEGLSSNHWQPRLLFAFRLHWALWFWVMNKSYFIYFSLAISIQTQNIRTLQHPLGNPKYLKTQNAFSTGHLRTVTEIFSSESWMRRSG